MTTAVVGSPSPVPQPDEARLRKVVQQLEGVFVEQLFKAMRETVPDGGLVDGGSGEEIFSGLLDQHLSAEVPAGWGERGGLSEALYRQLSRRIQAAEAPSPPSAPDVLENR
jgi:flagellar protein FlgJ